MFGMRLSRKFPFALLHAAMSIMLVGWLGGGGVVGCAPSPNTRIDLTQGTYDSAKDIKLNELEALERGPDGQITRSVKIKGLDSSASSVIEAQAKAMQAQAEAFGAFAGGLDKLADKIPVSTPAGLAAKSLIRGASSRAASTARPRPREQEEEPVEEDEASSPPSDEQEAEEAPKPSPPPRKPAAAKPPTPIPPVPTPATSPDEDPASEEPS